jgi:hypothetical protein
MTPAIAFERRKARPGRLISGALLILWASASQTLHRAPAGVAESLGHLVAALILMVPAIWLIASGLPQTIGLDKAQRRTRRRIWYLLAGGGLPVTVIVVFSLISADKFVGHFGGGMAVVLVLWFFYWYGWIWISWLIADRWAIRRFQRRRDGATCTSS